MKRTRVVEFALPPVEQLTRPLWRGVEQAIAWQIDVGRVPAGARVPSTRTLARQLGLSRNTVALAFDHLIADGYFDARVGDGTYVRPLEHRARAPLWRRKWTWLRDPDGSLVRVTVASYT